MSTGITGLPQWVELLIFGLIIVYFMAIVSLVLARTGRSPVWTLLLLIPVVQVVVIWAFAYCHWPRVDDSQPERRRFEAGGRD